MNIRTGMLCVVVLTMAALVLAGCSANQSTGTTTGRGPDVTEQTNAHSDPSGKQIFDNNCAQCHGTNGEMISGWKEDVRSMSLGAIESQVKNGGGGMPAFKGQLSSGQITKVAKYAKKLASE